MKSEKEIKQIISEIDRYVDDQLQDIETKRFIKRAKITNGIFLLLFAAFIAYRVYTNGI